MTSKTPLAFDDFLIFKYSSSFKYLEGYDLELYDISKARLLRNEIINKGRVITQHTSYNSHRILCLSALHLNPFVN